MVKNIYNYVEVFKVFLWPYCIRHISLLQMQYMYSTHCGPLQVWLGLEENVLSQAKISLAKIVQPAFMHIA